MKYDEEIVSQKAQKATEEKATAFDPATGKVAFDSFSCQSAKVRQGSRVRERTLFCDFLCDL